MCYRCRECFYLVWFVFNDVWSWWIGVSVNRRLGVCEPTGKSKMCVCAGWVREGRCFLSLGPAVATCAPLRFAVFPRLSPGFPPCFPCVFPRDRTSPARPARPVSCLSWLAGRSRWPGQPSQPASPASPARPVSCLSWLAGPGQPSQPAVRTS